MVRPLELLLIAGSLRAGSTNTAVLVTALAVAPDGVATVLYDGMGGLPHFNPDDDGEGDPVHPAVAELRARDAVGPDGDIADPQVREQITAALSALGQHLTQLDAGSPRA